MRYSLQIITSFMAMHPVDIWEVLRASHALLLEDDMQCRFREHHCLVKDVSRKIRASAKPHFEIEIEEGDIDYCPVANYDHSLIWINGLVTGIDDAEMWVGGFLGEPGFVMAWVYDSEYTKWQNADDPLIYRAAGRSYAGLPMKSNRLPYPLEQQVIDISSNPGRRELRTGYVESVGSVMWLGPRFWARTGTSREAIAAARDFGVTEIAGGVTRIQAFERPFSSAEGEQGRLQVELRSLLFPHADN